MEIKKQATAVICLSPYGGGMEVDSINIAKKLSLYTNTTMIVQKGYFIEEQKESYLNYNGIKLETISFSSSLSFNIIFKVREIIKKNNIKNVIFFGASELKSLYFSFLGLDINLIIRHGTTKTHPKKDWFHRLIYSNVSYHISNSKYMEKNVKYIIPFGKNTKSSVIFTSFPIHLIETKENEKLTIVHVGRVARGKGQHDAIQACEILVQHNIDFVFNIVGAYDPDYKEEFENFYDNCQYKDKISLIGFTKEVNNYLCEADIFLFPSHGEGFGNAFVEAMATQNICITYDNTSFPYFKEMGFYFHTAKNKDYEDLSKILLKVSENLHEEKGKSLNNVKLIESLFSLEKEIESYLEILK